MTLKIGTRGSKLALFQANFVKSALENEGIRSKIVVIKTKGDQIQDLPLAKLEGKGFFTKEIEDALLANEVDIAVHSLKDMPTSQPDGLVLAALVDRNDPSDILLIHPKSVDSSLELGYKSLGVVGTSSARRKSQILDMRPDTKIKDIRGNVPTRIKKLKDGQYDSIILAAAGVNRLNIDLSELKMYQFDPREFVPAPGQGVITIQCRIKDLQVRRTLKRIHQSSLTATTNIERRVLQLFDGGCHLPLGVYCKNDAQGNFHAHAMIADAGRSKVHRFRHSSSTSHNMAEHIFQSLTDLMAK